MPPHFDEADLRRNFEAQETEELRERLERGLVPEAELLARQILTERGASLIMQTTRSPKEDLPVAIWTPELRQEEQDLARKLWRSFLVRACQFLFFFVPGVLVSITLNLANKMTFADGEIILVAVAIYAGYWGGMKITRKIVASDSIRYSAKVKRIWALLVVVVLIYMAFPQLLR